MAGVRRPSGLKRQKEQMRLARARAKHEARLARRRARRDAQPETPADDAAAVQAPAEGPTDLPITKEPT